MRPSFELFEERPRASARVGGRIITAAGPASARLVPASRPLLIGCAESDDGVAELLERTLTGAGHTTVLARSGAAAIRRFATDQLLDVILIESSLSDMDGPFLCGELRDRGQRAPVLFLSAKHDVDEVLRSFAAGGLDFVVRPFAVQELLVRIESLARRAVPGPRPSGLQLEKDRLALRLGGGSRSLTPTEFELMALLIARTGRLVRRPELVDAAWPPGARVAGNTFDTYLYRLREHLRLLPSTATIRTVRGVGYILQLGPEDQPSS